MPGFSYTPALFLALPVALAAASNANAQTAPSPSATIAVSNCNDSGPGSLRDAVALAANGDTIDLRLLECRRLVLTSGQIRIWQDDLTLLGPTRAFTIDGNDASRVLRHFGTGTLRLRAMSIANGYSVGREPSGGCIRSDGDLQLEYTRVHDCFVMLTIGWAPNGGGGIVGNDIALYDSEVFGNTHNGDGEDDLYPFGGGIWAHGHLALVRSRVSDNTAGGRGTGGGFVAEGGLDMLNSEMTGNFSCRSGALNATGGDVTINGSLIANNESWSYGMTDLSGPSILVMNTTVSGNLSYQRSGLTLSGNQQSLINSTIVDNDVRGADVAFCGGAVVSGGLLHVESTIIASNPCGGVQDWGPLEVIGSDNLITESSVSLPPDTISANPRISPLADNGGRTRTHALWAGSPAVDMGNNNAGLEFDQRGPGFDRVNGTRADIGAYER